MPDQILRVGAEFDVGPLLAGMQAAGASFDVLKKQLMDQGLSAELASKTIKDLGLSEIEVAATAKVATDATTGLDRAIAGATGRMLGMEAGLGMAGGALGRIAAFLPGMATLWEVALPVALISLGVDKISQFRDEVEKASEKMADFAIESYKTADSIQLQNLKLADEIRTLEGAPKETGLKTALLEAKIEAENLSKALEGDIQKSIDLLNVGTLSQFFTRASGPESDFKEKLQEITAKIQEARMKLAEAPPGSEASKAAIQAQIDGYNQLQQQLDLDILALRGMEGSSHRLDDSIAKLKELQIGAKESTVSLQEMTKGAALKEEIPGIEAAKAAEKERIRLLKEQAEAEKVLKEVHAGGAFPAEQVTQPPDTQTMANAQNAMAQLAVAAAQQMRDQAATAGDQLDLAFEKSFEKAAEIARKGWEKVNAEAKKAAEEQKHEVDHMAETMTRAFENSFDGVVRGTETVKFAFIRLGGDMVLAVIHSLEQQVAHFAAAEITKLALHVSGQTAQTAATASGTSSREAIEEVAFLKFLAREAAKLAAWIAREVGQTLAAIAGFVQREAILIAETVATITKYAAQAAAGAFAATAGIPFIGPFLAPAAAAAAFVGVEAWGFAEQGAVLPHDTMVAAHKNEMILPAPISSAVQGAVPAIQAFNAASKEGFGGAGAPGIAGAAGQHGASGANGSRSGGSTTNVNIHAFDSQSMADVLSRNRNAVLGLVRGAIRNGVRA